MIRYSSERQFEIPEGAFDNEGEAHFTVSGGSDGGWWNLAAFSRHIPPGERREIGSIRFNGAVRRPDLAGEVAKTWMEHLGKQHGFVIDSITNESSFTELYSISQHFAVTQRQKRTWRDIAPRHNR